jgi:hypothetical protein
LEWRKELMVVGGNAFSRLYRMELDSFMKLCDMLCPELEADEQMAMIRTSKSPIIV